MALLPLVPDLNCIGDLMSNAGATAELSTDERAGPGITVLWLVSRQLKTSTCFVC